MNPNDPSQLPDYLRLSPAAPVSGQNASVPSPSAGDDKNAAADLIRQKLAAIYADEPDAQVETAKIEQQATPLSRHQEYLESLHGSGKSWVEIQNAWHEYYGRLGDQEKRDVWQEFYASSRSAATPAQQELQARDQAAGAGLHNAPRQANGQSQRTEPVVSYAPRQQHQTRSARHTSSARDIKQHILSTVSSVSTGSGKKLQAKDHLKSLGFGLASGAIVVFFVMFTFFNEVFISPFIQPSRKVTNTPVIVDTASAVVGQEPKVLIPKINVEIPVDYSQTTTDEAAIEAALDKGIVHYPTTVKPGEPGNAAFFGHSSNNIFNPGKYKFAFALLHKLVIGDTFYLTYNGKSYAYQMISRQVVEPSQVGVLGPIAGETATATLITCDPPGTSLKRLVVVGRQISPDPGANAPAATPAPVVAAAETAPDLPGNGPTLWSRIWSSIF